MRTRDRPVDRGGLGGRTAARVRSATCVPAGRAAVPRAMEWRHREWPRECGRKPTPYHPREGERDYGIGVKNSKRPASRRAVAPVPFPHRDRQRDDAPAGPRSDAIPPICPPRIDRPCSNNLTRGQTGAVDPSLIVRARNDGELDRAPDPTNAPVAGRRGPCRGPRRAGMAGAARSGSSSAPRRAAVRISSGACAAKSSPTASGNRLHREHHAGPGAVALSDRVEGAADGYTIMVLTAGFPPQAALRKIFPTNRSAASLSSRCGRLSDGLCGRAGLAIKAFGELLRRRRPARPITYSITALGSIYHGLTKWIEIEVRRVDDAGSYRGTGRRSPTCWPDASTSWSTPESAFPRIQAASCVCSAISSPARYPLMREAPTVPRRCLRRVHVVGSASHGRRTRRTRRRTASTKRRAPRWSCPTCSSGYEGGNVASPSTPEEMRQKVESEIARWSA